MRSETGVARSLNLPSKGYYQALKQTRKILSSEAGKKEYQKRAGVEGTLSQGVRRGCLRRSRYRGLKKTHLQEIAMAAGINILRTVNFLNGELMAKKRVSQFAKLIS